MLNKHFRESQYFHIPPNLPKYYCPYKDCHRVRKPFKKWYTFGFHLAWQHKEFNVKKLKLKFQLKESYLFIFNDVTD